MTRLFAILLLAAVAGTRPGLASAGESVEYLYRLKCSGCHGMAGAGSAIGRIPPFTGLVGHFADSRDGRLYLVHVPGVANSGLPDADTADVLNYVLRKWGGDGSPAPPTEFTAMEVATLRSIHLDDIAALRRKLAASLSRRGVSTDS
jgi:mono/diheme cytochrome c family protein